MQINGTGFGATQGSSTVSIGGYPPASVVSWSNTQIVASVVNYAFTSMATVTVGGVSSNTDNVFTVSAAQVTSIAPTSGVVGAQVTITGTNFQSTQPTYSWVRVNNLNATVVSWSNTQIVATIPSGATTGPVTVTANSNSSNLTSNENVIFTMPNPVVTSLAPTSGPGGTTVQVNGSGFGASQGSSTVAFNGVNAAVTSWSDTQITTIVPTAATNGPMKVTEGGVASSENFTVPAPQITGISPTSGAVGTQVTINGANFQATRPATSSVTFNGYSATIVSWSNNQIVAAVPSGATTGVVAVSVNNVSSNQDVQFAMPHPVVTGLSPSGGPVGAQVQISGSGFGASQGTSTVSFYSNHNATINSWSDTQITATVPAGAFTGAVTVTEGGVASAANPTFTVDTVVVNSVSPHGGPIGTQVTVYGSGFGASQGSSTLSFSNTAATSISSWSNSQIVATVPAGSTTGAVKIVNAGVSSNTTVNFTVSTVVVSSVSPASGFAGSQFQINGSGFGVAQGSSTVKVNGYSASIVAWSNTQITVNDAANLNASGGVIVTVGSAQSNGDVTFTVTPPVVTSLSPTSGPVGTQVQINGNNFGATQGTSTITFNNVAVTVNSWSNNQIVATLPATVTSGAVQVTVGGAWSLNNPQFTVPSPQVMSITPSSGSVGTQVTVAGSGFQATRPSSGALYFNTIGGGLVAATIISWGDTQIVAAVPATAVSGCVKVYVNAYSNADVEFTMPTPTVTGVSPTTGPVGTQVQVNGIGFGATQGTSSIAFAHGTAPYFTYSNATVVSWSDAQIVAVVPSTATTGPVKVTTGGVVSNTNVYYAVPAPQITSISPTTGVVGTQVTITGSGFQATQGSNWAAFYNGSTTVNSWSDTQIVATVGSGVTTGPVNVSVNGALSNQNVQFTVPNPLITSITPSTAPVGTLVQINGVGFGATQGSSSVAFYSNVAAAVVSWSDTQIVVTVPATAQSGSVKVTEGGVSSNTNIDFGVPAPQITSLSPSSGVIGTQVTINGSGFQAAQGNGYVVFNNSGTAAITSWSDTQIVATVPTMATTGSVTVHAANGALSNQNVVFALPNPVITSLAPASGVVGAEVQVNGMGFGATQGSSTVTLAPYNAAAAVLSWSDTQIVVTVPAGAGGSAPVRIHEGGVTSTSNTNFTVFGPTIASITPTIGGAGNVVTITGSNFQATQNPSGSSWSSVSFAGGGLASISSWSDSQIVAKVPAGSATGPVAVTVSTVSSNSVNYTIPNNVVTAVSPAQGPVGTQVTVTGAGFGTTQGTSTLTFNGQAATSIASWSDTQIVATVPATAATGPAAVTVNNVPGNLNVIFSVPAPFISSYTPAGGVAGTPVTIAGTGFTSTQGANTVTFNGVAGSVTSWSDTQIVVNVPSSAATGPLLVTVNGVATTSQNSFEVPNPVITGLAPPEVPIGGKVTITGSGFGPYAFKTDNYGELSQVGSVNVNGAVATVVSWSDTQVTALVIEDGPAPTGNVTVTKYNATSNGFPFKVEGAPTVTGYSPASGPAGTSVTITGSGFGSTQSTSAVSLNGVPAAVSVWADDHIIATIPGGAYSGSITINVGGVNSLANLDFIVTITRQTTDSLGNTSSYTSENIGGGWYNTQATGSGCSSCTVRGNISNQFDIYGNLLSHTDELGHVTTYTYDSNYNVMSVSQQLDTTTTVTTSFVNNSFGEPLTVTDPLGNVTTNAYDGNGNLLTVTSPAPNSTTQASVTKFAYDSKGELTQITDPLGNITALTYNPVGLIATIKDAQQNVTTYGYDQHGNRTSITDAANNQTTFTYDAGDRLTKITYPDTNFITFAYDTRGRRTSVTDQNGKTTTYTYDDADRLTQVKNAANNITQYAYDTENNLLSITDANNHTTSFTYDAFARVKQTTFPSTLTESYLYDAMGNLTNKTDRNGHSILYVYDALNRLTHKGYPDSTSVDYIYDLAGKIKQVTDPTGTYSMAYDNMGRLIGTTTQYSFLTGTPTFTNSYAYDAASNRTSLTLPDASNNTYQYDTLNRLKALTDSVTGQFNFSYDTLSRRTSLTRPNGVNTNYGYDSLSRLLSVLHKTGTTTLDGASYTYDNAGNRTAKTNSLNSVTEQYTYDPLYQLTQVTQGTTTTESYNYDSVGNRLSSLGVSTYSYNSSNELTANSAASFTYDNNGNSLTKTDSTGTRNYTWDFENRLSSVALPGSGGTVTFKYDPFGRRIQKSSTSGTTNYLYDAATLIEEVDNNGNELARYAQGPGVDQPLAETRSGTTSYYQQDAIASVTSLSSNAGTLANTYTYDAFGNLTASTGSLGNPFQYTGRDYDPETGLRYYRARYYDPPTGRFLSEDPIGLVGGINFYAYALNNPIILRDPTGHSAGAVAIPIGEGIGWVVCFDSGVCEAVIVGGAIVVGVAATGYLIYNYFSGSKSDAQSKAKPSPKGPKCDNSNRAVCEQLYQEDMEHCAATFLNPDSPNTPGYETCAAQALLNLERCLEWVPGTPPRAPMPNRKP